jgi:hypothetical protein
VECYLTKAEGVIDTLGPMWRCPGGGGTMLDLRPAPEQASNPLTTIPTGAIIAFYPTTRTIAGATYLGNDFTGNLTVGQRTALRNALSIGTAFTATAFGGIVAEILGAKSDPTNSVRAKPILPNTAGNIEVIIAGVVAFRRAFTGTGDAHWGQIQAVEQADYRSVRTRCLAFASAINGATQGDGSLAARLITGFALANKVTWATAQSTVATVYTQKYLRYLGGLVRKYAAWSIARQQFIPAGLSDEGELPPQTTLTDDFNRADSGTMGTASGGFTWTQYGAGMGIGSNQLITNSLSFGWGRAESDLSSADHTAQLDVINYHTTVDGAVGTAVRYDASSNTSYSALIYSGGSPQLQVYKVVSGSMTQIATGNTTIAPPETAKTGIAGSTITLYQSGVSVLSTTDTSITGNLRTGAFVYAGNNAGHGIFDNFQGDDGAGGGLTDYTLTADFGSYSLTGEAARLLYGHKLTAAQGAYALTGEPAGLKVGRLVAAAQGSYSLTGEAAGLLKGRTLTANFGSYAITGESAGLLAARTMPAAQGSYVLSGQTANLLRGFRIPAGVGSYLFTGEDAGLQATRLLTAARGSYALTGQSATLDAGSRIVRSLRGELFYVPSLSCETHYIPTLDAESDYRPTLSGVTSVEAPSR